MKETQLFFCAELSLRLDATNFVLNYPKDWMPLTFLDVRNLCDSTRIYSPPPEM